jgi:hypothetical protein
LECWAFEMWFDLCKSLLKSPNDFNSCCIWIVFLNYMNADLKKCKSIRHVCFKVKEWKKWSMFKGKTLLWIYQVFMLLMLCASSVERKVIKLQVLRIETCEQNYCKLNFKLQLTLILYMYII